MTYKTALARENIALLLRRLSRQQRQRIPRRLRDDIALVRQPLEPQRPFSRCDLRERPDMEAYAIETCHALRRHVEEVEAVGGERHA